MLLRRVIDHVREQNWTAVGIDFVFVVVGVVIGIQVANWNEERQGAEQQQRYVERLAADFRSIQQRIDRHFATFEGTIEGADYILQLLRLSEAEFREFAVDEPRLKDATASLDHMRIPPGSSATYLEMVSAGQLSALGNPVLRDKLAEYERLSGIHLEGMRRDPEFEIAVMIVQTATRNNYGLRRLEARLVDEILALLDAELAR